jgi:photosystem II stability/assembly factor-like uncharacterized protein
MIKCIYFFVFLAQFTAYSQWFWQNPLPSGNNFSGIHFINHNVGFVVGGYGTLLKSTDQGESWSFVNHDFYEHFNDIVFTDENTGYICGSGGLLIKTTDGGNSWIIQNTYTTSHLVNLHFINSDVGLAVGWSGRILRTTNGGINWTQINSGTYRTLNKITMSDSSTGYITGDNGTILKTTNAGASWSTLNSGTTVNLTALSFISNSTGYAAGNNGTVLRTTNGGGNWTPVPVTGSYYFYDIKFKNELDGLMAGNKIYRTTDGGVTWNLVSNKNSYRILYLNQKVISVGFRGIMKSEDDGLSWINYFNGSYESLYGVSFPSSSVGFAVGNNGTILKSTDAGASWISKNSGLSIVFTDVYFTNNLTGYVVGRNNTLIKTTDGGETWSPLQVYINTYSPSIVFVNDTTGFITGSNFVMKTTDAGIQWRLIQVGSNILNDIFFPSENVGFIAGNSGMFKTTDMGETWVKLNGSVSSGLHFIDNNIGTAVGAYGGIRRTTDGGETWTNQVSLTFAPLNAVWFTDENNGVAVGGDSDYYSAVILTTTNGGEEWIHSAPISFNAFQDIQFTSDNTGIIVGRFGTILRTQNLGGIPVELTSFTASIVHDNIELKWNTSTEVNNKGFEILKKSEDNGYNQIAFVDGKGTTTEESRYIFTDHNVKPGKYYYKLIQIDYDGKRSDSKEIEVEYLNNFDFILHQNYPNPFNPITKIKFNIPAREYTTLKIYNMLGAKVAEIINKEKEPGSYEIEFDAANLSSGVYMYTLTSGRFTMSKKLLIVK